MYWKCVLRWFIFLNSKFTKEIFGSIKSTLADLDIGSFTTYLKNFEDTSDISWIFSYAIKDFWIWNWKSISEKAFPKAGLEPATVHLYSMHNKIGVQSVFSRHHWFSKHNTGQFRQWNPTCLNFKQMCIIVATSIASHPCSYHALCTF